MFSTSSTTWSPLKISNSCSTVPAFVTTNVVLPALVVIVEGSNLYSVAVTAIEPGAAAAELVGAGAVGATAEAPQAAVNRAIDAIEAVASKRTRARRDTGTGSPRVVTASGWIRRSW